MSHRINNLKSLFLSLLGASLCLYAPACTPSEESVDISTATSNRFALVPTCDFYLSGTYNLCSRYVASHVSVDSLERKFDLCVPDLIDLLRQRKKTSDCPTVDYIQPVFYLHRSIYEKLGEAVAYTDESETNVENIRTYTQRIGLWYEKWKELSADYEQEFSAGDEQKFDLDDEYFHIQGIVWQMLQQGRKLDEDVKDILHMEDNAAKAEVLEEAMGKRQKEAEALDADVIRALFPADMNADVPIRGVPLLSILGAALYPVYNRLNSMTAFHDYGCDIADCDLERRQTPVSDLWKLLAHLDDGLALQSQTRLKDLAESSPYFHSGWKEVLSIIGNRVDLITEALSEALISGSYNADAIKLSKTQWETPAVRFVDILSGAIERHKNYQSTGFFYPKTGKYLKTAVHYNMRTAITNLVDSELSQLEQHNLNFRREIVSLVNAFVQQNNTTANLNEAEDRQEIISEELDDILQRRNANIAAAALSKDLHAELAAELKAVGGILDGEGYVALEEITNSQGLPLTFSGKDAKYVNLNKYITDVSVSKLEAIRLEANEFLFINISSNQRWSPVCSLNEREFVTPQGEVTTGFSTGDAEIGPEGFNVQWNGSAYETRGVTHTWGKQSTYGVKAELCVNETQFEGAVGIGRSACEYTDFHYTESTNKQSSSGVDSRTSAAFSGGLRLRNTPFPDAPAGSLLVIEMPHDSEKTELKWLRDVHVLRTGSNVIPVQDKAKLYFVVNDSKCEGADDEHELSVEVTKMATANAVAENLLERMRYVLLKVRKEKQMLEERREILSTELSAIRSQAILDTISNDESLEFDFSATQVPLSSYPETLRAMFTAFLDKELLRLERAVRISNLNREIEIKRSELFTADIELKAAKANDALISYLPNWHMKDLYGVFMRYESQHFIRFMQEYFLPICKLWYPDALEEIKQYPVPNSEDQGGRGDILDALLAFDIDESLEVQIQRVIFLSKVAIGQYQKAAEIQKEFADNGSIPKDTVIVSFGLNPYYSENPYNVEDTVTLDPREAMSEARVIPEEIARPVWTALRYGGRVTIQLSPENIYQTDTNTSSLSCSRALPVLRHAVLVSRQGTPVSSSIPRSFADCRVGTRQLFPARSGLEDYTMLPGAPTTIEVPRIYVSNNDFVNEVRERVAESPPPIGISPLSAITFDFDTDLWTNDYYYNTEELFLVLRIESMQNYLDGLNWIATCLKK